MNSFKKVVICMSTALFVFMSSGVTAFAFGDPEPVEETEVLPENPIEEVAEDDHTPLTFDGTGTVVDNILNGSKQFYTISTDAGNVFYLIVDLDKEYNNVYLLDTTKERDLIALAEKADKAEGIEIKEESVPQKEEPEPPQEPVVEEPVKKDDNTALYIIFGILLFGAGGVIFYYWFYKPRKDQEQAEEFDENFDFKNEDKGYDDALEELNSYDE